MKTEGHMYEAVEDRATTEVVPINPEGVINVQDEEGITDVKEIRSKLRFMDPEEHQEDCRRMWRNKT